MPIKRPFHPLRETADLGIKARRASSPESPIHQLVILLAVASLIFPLVGCSNGVGSEETPTPNTTRRIPVASTTTPETLPPTTLPLTTLPSTTSPSPSPAETTTPTTTQQTTTTTPMGTTWQRADVTGLEDVNVVTNGLTGFVIAGRQGDSIALWTSDDGLTWSPVDVPADAFPPDYVIHDLAWTGSEYIALAAAWQNTTDPVAWRSADLVTWQPIDLLCPTHPIADEVATDGGMTIIWGSCDGDGTVWTSTDEGSFLQWPAPFADAATGPVHAAGSWYALSEPTLWRSDNGESWTPVDLPVLQSEEVYPGQRLHLAAREDTLYLVADGYGLRGELWTRTGDTEWGRVEGASSVGEDLYHSGAVLAGPAGALVSWSVGYPPSAHATQSPACLERGDVVVCLYRELKTAVFITDLDGELLLQVDFPDGGGPASHVEIDVKAEEVCFLHPTSGAVLAELTFTEIEDALRLEEPKRHTWWSADGSSWKEWTEAHVHTYPRWTAIGDLVVVSVELAERTDLPRWVRRMLGVRTDPMPQVWVRRTG